MQHRSLSVVARIVAATTLCLTLSACASTGLPDTGADAPPPAARATEPARPPVTPTPSATATGPVDVLLSLADAEATVMAPIQLPELDARVERSYYLRARDLREELKQQRSYPDAAFQAMLGLLVSSEEPDEDVLSSTYAVVEASYRDLWTQSAQRDEAQGDDRTQVQHRFEVDPGSYALQRPISVGLWREGMGDALAPRQPAVVVVTETPRPTREHTAVPDATATFLPPSDAPLPTLSDGAVPRGILPEAAALPIVPGGRWTYRAVELEQGVITQASERTYRLDQAWRESDSSMIVRGGGYFPIAPSASGLRLSIRGLDACTQEPVSALGDSWPWPSGSVWCPDFQDLVPGAWIRDPDAQAWPAERVEGVVAVPAGTFDDCWFAKGGVGIIQHQRWYCRGAGMVKSVDTVVSGGDGYRGIHELVDYEIPTLVPVP